MATNFIALDVGQSGIRCVHSVDGNIDSRSSPVGVNAVLDIASARSYAARVRQVLPTTSNIATPLFIGTTGFPLDPSLANLLLDELVAATQVQSVIVVSDAVTGLVGAVDEGVGVAFTWGTGAVAFGADTTSWARTDGRGHLLGDSGSGFWIGQRGLVAALDHGDRRDGSEALAQAAADQLGDFAEIYATVHRDPDPVRYIAAFSRAVVAAADHGDPIANDILDEAAQHAYRTVAANLAQLSSLQKSPMIAITGGLSTVDALHRRLATLIYTELETSTVIVAPDAHLTGITRIANAGRPDPRFAELFYEKASTPCST